jgi:flagellar FliL protein
MADKKDTAAEAPAKSGKGKLVVIAVAGATVLLAGAGGAWFMLGKQAQVQGEATPKAAPRRMPVFVELDTFTVNLKDKEDERFLQARLVLEVRDSSVSEMLKTLMPSVRNELLLLLGSKQVAEISTREGKEKLAQEIVASANKAIAGTPAANGVEGVNFTHLIIQ